MQQVVLFSSSFASESSDFLKNELIRVGEIPANDLQGDSQQVFEQHFKSPYEKLEIQVPTAFKRLQDIVERYKGLLLGLPEDWFHFNDRLEVNIFQKDIGIKGNPAGLLLMPDQGTPVRIIANDDYTTSPILNVLFITNINFGDQEAVTAFEQECDQKIVQIQGNIDLLNQEIARFNEDYQTQILKRLPGARNSVT